MPKKYTSKIETILPQKNTPQKDTKYTSKIKAKYTSKIKAKYDSKMPAKHTSKTPAKYTSKMPAKYTSKYISKIQTIYLKNTPQKLTFEHISQTYKINYKLTHVQSIQNLKESTLN